MDSHSGLPELCESQDAAESTNSPRVTFIVGHPTGAKQANNTSSLTELTRNWSIDHAQDIPLPTRQQEVPRKNTRDSSRERKRARGNQPEPSSAQAPSTSSTQQPLNITHTDLDTQPTTSLTTAEHQADRRTLDNFRVSDHIESIWRQTRSTFITVEKYRCRSQRLTQWADKGLLPQWAIGTGNIPPHLLGEPKDQTTVGSLLQAQAKSLLLLLASSLRAQASIKESQAKALLNTVQTLYGEDANSFYLAKQKILSFCIKERADIALQLDRQEASLKAANNTPEGALAIRCPTLSTSGQQPSGRTGRRPRSASRNTRPSSRGRGPSSSRHTRKRSRSSGRNPRLSTEQQLAQLLKRLTAKK